MPGFRKLLRTAGRARLATYLVALWKLFRHPDTPRRAKYVAVAVLAYVLSPIDLVPDFIPFAGQLDDLVLVPLGITLAVRLTPAALWHARLQEAERHAGRWSWVLWGVGLVVLAWLAAMVGLVWWLWPSGGV